VLVRVSIGILILVSRIHITIVTDPDTWNSDPDPNPSFLENHESRCRSVIRFSIDHILEKLHRAGKAVPYPQIILRLPNSAIKKNPALPIEDLAI
jgi:hypothetical protein